ncbi:hypothetical protein OKW35_000597 [Paraburkholderia sp. MM5477-R1]
MADQPEPDQVVRARRGATCVTLRRGDQGFAAAYVAPLVVKE